MKSNAYLTVVVNKADGRRIVLADKVKNVFTTAGKDAFHALDYTNPSGTYRGFGCIGLTESTITPAVGDTSLTGEISTNGLARADATTKTHTAGTNSSTISHVFTATGAFTSVLASALFNATSSGTMAHIANFATGSGILASADTLTVTWTCNLS